MLFKELVMMRQLCCLLCMHGLKAADPPACGTGFKPVTVRKEVSYLSSSTHFKRL
jgi:hypothetical protein